MKQVLAFLKNNKLKITIAVLLLILLICGWLLLKPKDTAPKISDILPHSQTVPPTQFFTIAFENIPSAHQKELLKTVIQPTIKFTTEYNDQNLIITPEQLLSPGQGYKITLLYNNTPYFNVAFKTKTLNQMTPEEEQLFQAQADQNYSNQLQSFYEKYPWMQKLPLETKDFVAVYDPELQSVRIRLLTKSSEVLKTSIIKTLTDKGIPTTKIVWIEPTPVK